MLETDPSVRTRPTQNELDGLDALVDHFPPEGEVLLFLWNGRREAEVFGILRRIALGDLQVEGLGSLDRVSRLRVF